MVNRQSSRLDAQVCHPTRQAGVEKWTLVVATLMQSASADFTLAHSTPRLRGGRLSLHTKPLVLGVFKPRTPYFGASFRRAWGSTVLIQHRGLPQCRTFQCPRHRLSNSVAAFDQALSTRDNHPTISSDERCQIKLSQSGLTGATVTIIWDGFRGPAPAQTWAAIPLLDSIYRLRRRFPLLILPAVRHRAVSAGPPRH